MTNHDAFTALLRGSLTVDAQGALSLERAAAAQLASALAALADRELLAALQELLELAYFAEVELRAPGLVTRLLEVARTAGGRLPARDSVLSALADDPQTAFTRFKAERQRGEAASSEGSVKAQQAQFDLKDWRPKE
jgi:hypothetical protein